MPTKQIPSGTIREPKGSAVGQNEEPNCTKNEAEKQSSYAGQATGGEPSSKNHRIHPFLALLPTTVFRIGTWLD
jgi:hypothetical protein